MSWNSRYAEGQQAYCWNIDDVYRRTSDPVYNAGYQDTVHEAHVIQSGKYLGPGCQIRLEGF